MATRWAWANSDISDNIKVIVIHSKNLSFCLLTFNLSVEMGPAFSVNCPVGGDDEGDGSDGRAMSDDEIPSHQPPGTTPD